MAQRSDRKAIKILIDKYLGLETAAGKGYDSALLSLHVFGNVVCDHPWPKERPRREYDTSANEGRSFLWTIFNAIYQFRQLATRKENSK